MFWWQWDNWILYFCNVNLSIYLMLRYGKYLLVFPGLAHMNSHQYFCVRPPCLLFIKHGAMHFLVMLWQILTTLNSRSSHKDQTEWLGSSWTSNLSPVDSSSTKTKWTRTLMNQNCGSQSSIGVEHDTEFPSVLKSGLCMLKSIVLGKMSNNYIQFFRDFHLTCWRVLLKM